MSTDQLHNGTCDDDSPVQFIWRDEACGVTSRYQIVQIPHNEGCINLLNDRAGPAQWSLCVDAMKSRGLTGAVAFVRVYSSSY